jgi:metal-dependent amidase/aminoacylase/carboxypeptidase family protein
MIEGAPGHGEGHNSGQAVNIVAALAVKEIMEREKIGGTLMLWPGVAEELLGGKAYMVREGVFDDVDAVLFTHVGNNLRRPGVRSTERAWCRSNTPSAASPRIRDLRRGGAAAPSTRSNS